MATTDRLDGYSGDSAIKVPCKVATIASITLSGEQTIDGAAVVAGERVLVKNQASSIDNGVYIVSTTAWARAKDFNGARDVVHGTRIYAFGGSTQDAGTWIITTADVIVVGSSAIAFALDASGVGAVASVNGQTDVVVLTATDIGGFAGVAISGDYTDLTNTPTIPTLTSELTNDSSFITAASAPVASVAGKTGVVTLDSGDISNFTEAAQDVVGALVADSSTINATYDDAGALQTFDVIAKLNDLVTATGNYSMGTSYKITNHADPSSAQDVATKAYVDAAGSGGIELPLTPVRAATTAALAANTYANGASGVGATLTANANGALAAVDGVTLVLNDRLLVKNEVTGANNGIYYVSQVGTGGTPYILTRATDADQLAEVSGGLNTFVTTGTVNTNSRWVISSPTGSVTMGTTAIVFTLFDQSAIYTGGSGITITGTSIAIDTAITVNKTSAQTLTNKTLTSPVWNGTLSGDAFLDEDTMSSNSATKVASQQSIKAYVDAGLATVSGFYDVTRSPYNATGDGTTDDTAAIQSAIDACSGAGGGVVFFPANTYGVLGDGDASNGAIVAPSNVILKGSGMGASIIKLLNGQQAIGDITGIIRTESGTQTRNVGICDLTIDGNRANVTTRVVGLYFGVSPSHRAKVVVLATNADFTTYNDGATATRAHGLTTGDIVFLQNDNNPGLNGDFTITVDTATTFHITVASGTASDTVGYTWYYDDRFSLIADEDITITNVEIKNCDDYAFDPHERVARLTMTNCHGHDNGALSDGFTFDGVYDSIISNCYAYNNGRNGFNAVTNCNNVSFINCHSYDNGQYGFASQRGSTTVPRNRNLRFIGGSSYSNTERGIRLQMSVDTIVSGMNIYENGTNGIRVDGSINCKIANNSFRDNGQTTTNTYDDILLIAYTFAADSVVYASQYNTVSDNTFNATLTKKTRYNIREEADSSGYNNYLHNKIITKGTSGDYLVTDKTSTVVRLSPVFKNVRDYGAMGDSPIGGGAGGTDDTDAFQAALNDLAATGGKLYIPAGRYKISSPLTVTFTETTDDHITRPSIMGEGSGLSTLVWTGSSLPSSFMLTVRRTDTSGGGTSANCAIEGIGFRTATGKGLFIGGLKVVKWSFMTLRDIKCAGLTYGLWLDQVLSSSLYDIVMRFNNYGCHAVGGVASADTPIWNINNALTFTGCIFGNNNIGGLFVQDGSITFTGGTIESNGNTPPVGTALGACFGFKHVSSNSTLWSPTSVACTFVGTYFEANGTTGNLGVNTATADAWLIFPTEYNRHVYNFVGCSFIRVGPTGSPSAVYAPHAIYLDKSSTKSCHLNVTGCSFIDYNDYVEDASRKYILLTGSGTSSNLNISATGNYYKQNPTELPDFLAGTVYRSGSQSSFTRQKSYGAMVYQTNVQSVASLQWIPLTFGAASYNDASIWSGSNPTRLTVPAGATRVRLVGNMRWAINAYGNNHHLTIYKNGVGTYYGVAWTQLLVVDASTNNRTFNVSSPMLAVTGGDYFELVCFHNYPSQSANTDFTASPYSTWFSLEIIE